MRAAEKLYPNATYVTRTLLSARPAKVVFYPHYRANNAFLVTRLYLTASTAHNSKITSHALNAIFTLFWMEKDAVSATNIFLIAHNAIN